MSLVASLLLCITFTLTDPEACEPFVRLFDTVQGLLAPRCRSAFSRFCASSLFVQPNDFAHDVYVLYIGVEAFARIALLFPRQVLLIFVHAASED